MGVSLTNLDQPRFDGADATRRDLVGYLGGVRDRIVPELRDRPSSVVRVQCGQEALIQKNVVPEYASSPARPRARNRPRRLGNQIDNESTSPR